MKVGIDIGGSHISTGIVKNGGIIEDFVEKDLIIDDFSNEKRVQNVILDLIHSEIKILMDKYNYKINDIEKIGIAAPGSPCGTKLKNMRNLHLKEFDIGTILKEHYCSDVVIKNDGKCAGIAEKKYGVLKDYSDCAFLCIGTGVGSAVFWDNKLLTPKQNPGFELGHVIIEKDGKQCNCGKKGCFEVYASIKRFKQNFTKKMNLPENMDPEDMRNFIRKNINNEDVNKFIDEYLENVAIGISNIINIFEVEAICFGGSFCYYEDIFFQKLMEKTKKYLFNDTTKFEFVVPELKNNAGIIGACEI